MVYECKSAEAFLVKRLLQVDRKVFIGFSFFVCFSSCLLSRVERVSEHVLNCGNLPRRGLGHDKRVKMKTRSRPLVGESVSRGKEEVR